MASLGDMNIKVGADIADALTKINELKKANLGLIEETKVLSAEYNKNAKELRALEQVQASGIGVTNKTTKTIADLAKTQKILSASIVENKGLLQQSTAVIKNFEKSAATANTAGVQKLYSGLRTLANIIPGIGIGGLVALISGPVIDAFEEWFHITDKVTESQKALKKSLENVFDAPAKEATEVLSLIAVLKSETETRERKLAAIKELQKINPEVFGQLKIEKGEVIGLDTAYKNYLVSLKTVIAAKIIQARLEDKVTQLLKLQGIEESNVGKNIEAGLQKLAKTQGNFKVLEGLQTNAKKTSVETNKLNLEIEDLQQKLTEFSKGVKVPQLTDKIAGPIKAQVKEIKKRILEELKDFTIPLEDIFKTATKKVDPKGGIIFPTDEIIQEGKRLNELDEKLRETADIASKILAPAFDDLFTAIVDGSGNAFQSFAESLNQLIKKLIVAILKAAALAAILSFISPASKGGLSFLSRFTKLLGFAEGGEVKGPGSSKSDSIPARLSKGEFVMRAEAVKQFGVDFFNKLNQGRSPNFFGGIPKFAAGGFVSQNVISGAIGGGQQIFIAKSVIRGQDIVTTYQRASGTINRNS